MWSKRNPIILFISLITLIVINNDLKFLLIFIIIIDLVLRNQKTLKIKEYKIIQIILFIIIYVFIYNQIFYNKLNIESGDKVYLEVKKNLKIEDSYIKFETKYDHKIVEVIYYLDSKLNNEKNLLRYGDILEVKVAKKNIIENKFYNKSSFKYDRYMKSKRIIYQLETSNPIVVDNHRSIKNIIKNIRITIIKKLEEEYPKTSNIINTLIFGENIRNENIEEEISNVGITQLFTISGFHIVFMIVIIEYILRSLKIEDKYIKNVILVFLPIYTILAGGGVSVKRVTYTYYVKQFSKEKISTIDSTFIVMIINILLNPYILNSKGFILSYGISIYINLNLEQINSKENIVSPFKNIINNFNITMFILPITLLINSTVNIILPLTLELYNKLVKYMIISSLLFLSFYFLNINILIDLTNITIYILGILTELLNKINCYFVYTIGALNVPMFVIYYYFYIKQLNEYVLYKYKINKNLIIFMFILLFQMNSFNLVGKVHIIDIGQGDSILIEKAFSNQTILIDTGPKSSEDELISYLKSKGIRKIDYLVLTHNHEDHVGSIQSIIEKFRVKNLIINKNFNIDSYINSDNKYMQNINILKVDNLIKTPIGYFYSSSTNSENENNNSIIYQTNLGSNNWIFMGDAEKELESEVVEQFDLSEIDFIKLGHHGSKTSTTKELLEETNPKEVFISSGRNNIYNHPSEETIQKLEESNIQYKDTQQEGEITKLYI